MKKKILGAIALLFACVPMIANAETYKVDDNMSINLDESTWYVFTRDNIKDNSDLDELGITYDYMNDLFNKNNMYLDATIFYENGKDFIELLVRKNTNDEVKNLTNYSDEDVLSFAKELAKKSGSKDYDVYTNDYKFAHSKYVDSKVGYNVIEYYTIVNGTSYTITVQKPSEFDESEEEAIKDVIDEIKFNVDKSLKEKSDSVDGNEILSKAIVGAITGGIIGLVAATINKVNKKKKNNN